MLPFPLDGSVFFPSEYFSINTFFCFPNHAAPKIVRTLCWEGFLMRTPWTVWPLSFLRLGGRLTAGSGGPFLESCWLHGRHGDLLRLCVALSCCTALSASVLCFGMLSCTDPNPLTHLLLLLFQALPTCHEPHFGVAPWPARTPSWPASTHQGPLPSRTVPAHPGRCMGHRMFWKVLLGPHWVTARVPESASMVRFNGDNSH